MTVTLTVPTRAAPRVADVENWILYLQIERDRPYNTLKAYRRDVEDFIRFADPYFEYNWKWPEVNPLAVRRWKGSMKRRGLVLRSIARSTNGLLNFFRYLYNWRDLKTNPLRNLPVREGGRRLPQWLRLKQMDRFFDYLQTRAADEKLSKLRDLAIFETLYGTGVRLAELVGLNWLDVDLLEGWVRVRGRRERIVPLGRRAIHALTWYGVRCNGLETGGPVFLTECRGREGRISPRGVQRVAQKLLHQLFGQDHGLSVRSFRHSCAVHMLDAGANIAVVGELLGHVSLSTTQVYDRCSVPDLKCEHQKAHPRA